MMKQNHTIEVRAFHWLALCGVLAAVFYFLHVYLGAAAYPGYQWLEQAVSDLTAANAPSYAVASRYSTLYALFACLGTSLVMLLADPALPRPLRSGLSFYAVMNLVSAVGYTLFPLSSGGFAGTFQDMMHAYVVTSAVVLLSIVSLVMLTIGGFRHRPSRWLGIAAALALASMIAGPILMGLLPKSLFGLAERFSVYAAVIFTALLGIWGFLHGKARMRGD